MKIAFVASEAAPFCASGGLGDVAGALPPALYQSEKGIEVSVLLPLHRAVNEEYRRRMKEVYRGTLSLAWREIEFSVRSLWRRGVEYFFIDQARYFDRPSLYGEFDDGERYAFFSRAVISFLLSSDRVPDVVHLQDWQTALVAIYLRTVYAYDARTRGIRTVMTVHNIDYQGVFDRNILSDVLDIHPAHEDLLLHNGSLNLLKGGMLLADRVTTVSKRYAEELKEPTFGRGLSEVIAGLPRGIEGILNGIDLRAFDPKGKDLPYPYNSLHIEEGKRENRAAISSELGFPMRGKAPLLLMVGRLVEAKGIDLLLAAAEKILALGAYLVVLGTGEPIYEQALLELERKNPGKVRVILRFDRELSTKLYASADLFLMPSRREPCGLAQMIACRYGAVPVVRAVGGLSDSIVPWGRQGGCGFLFKEDSQDAFFDAVCDAITLYRADDGRWLRLAKAAMRTDFSWQRSALRYLALYRELKESV